MAAKQVLGQVLKRRVVWKGPTPVCDIYLMNIVMVLIQGVGWALFANLH